MKQKITAELLRELYQYDTSTGVMSKDGEPLGSMSQKGYLQTRLKGVHYKLHRLVWLYVTGSEPDGVVDHINGIKTDNRFENLRVCSSGENLQNQRRPQGTNRLIGACWHKASGLWQSQIKVNKKQHHLGYFKTEEEAHQAYVEAKRRLHPFGQL